MRGAFVVFVPFVVFVFTAALTRHGGWKLCAPSATQQTSRYDHKRKGPRISPGPLELSLAVEP
jgi:hypothetical protein